MPEKDAVLLDLDDTICEFQVTTEELLLNAFNEIGVEPFFGADDFQKWIPRVNAQSPLDLREKCFSSIAEEKGRDTETAYELAEAYDEPDPTDVEFVPGGEEFLNRVSQEHELGLVTNGGKPSQKKKLETLGIEAFFDACFFATPESVLKPDPEPFETVLESLGVRKKDSVHIGDSLESDIKGARNAGIDSVWVKNSERIEEIKTEPDYTVSSVSDLIDGFPWE